MCVKSCPLLSSQLVFLFVGYCRFCGKFQDRKNKLLIHLVKHDHSQIVDEVSICNLILSFITVSVTALNDRIECGVGLVVIF